MVTDHSLSDKEFLYLIEKARSGSPTRVYVVDHQRIWHCLVDNTLSEIGQGYTSLYSLTLTAPLHGATGKIYRTSGWFLPSKSSGAFFTNYFWAYAYHLRLKNE